MLQILDNALQSSTANLITTIQLVFNCFSLRKKICNRFSVYLNAFDCNEFNHYVDIFIRSPDKIENLFNTILGKYFIFLIFWNGVLYDITFMI